MNGHVIGRPVVKLIRILRVVLILNILNLIKRIFIYFASDIFSMEREVIRLTLVEQTWMELIRKKLLQQIYHLELL